MIETVTLAVDVNDILRRELTFGFYNHQYMYIIVLTGIGGYQSRVYAFSMQVEKIQHSLLILI